MLPPFFEDKDTHYAFAAIHDFFDNFTLSSALHTMESILKAANDTAVWKKDTPANLLHFMQKLEALTAAAFVLHYSHAITTAAILPLPQSGEPDMLVQQDFISHYHHSTLWNNFPRSLTAPQYHDPRRAIKKCCTWRQEREWKKILHDLTEYALSNNTIDDLHPTYNVLTLRLRLLQLVEACHLLDVRRHSLQSKSAAGQNSPQQMVV